MTGRPRCSVAMRAVSCARHRSLLSTAEKTGALSPLRWAPSWRACSRPVSLKGISSQPCSRRPAFHSVSPCRISQKCVDSMRCILPAGPLAAGCLVISCCRPGECAVHFATATPAASSRGEGLLLPWHLQDSFPLMSDSFFPRWRRVDSAAAGTVVQPDEYLPLPQSVAMGAQHVVAMFGSTILAPLLMGFAPIVAILMSGIGTLIFFLFVRGRVPSYLGSSFAFIGGVIAVTGYAGAGANANIGVALGAIIACGLVYTLIGLIVWWVNARTGGDAQWINRWMPPVVTGAVVAVIGLNLAPIAARGAMGGSTFDALMALMTVLCVGIVAVYTRGMVQRLLILV